MILFGLKNKLAQIRLCWTRRFEGIDFFDVTYSRQIDDLKSAIDYCEERLGIKEFGLMGSSMGGAVSLLVAGRDPRIKAVCTVAAIGYPSELEERYPLKTRGWRERGLSSSTARNAWAKLSWRMPVPTM